MKVVKIGDTVEVYDGASGVLKRIICGLDTVDRWCVVDLLNGHLHYCRIERLRVDGIPVFFETNTSEENDNE